MILWKMLTQTFYHGEKLLVILTTKKNRLKKIFDEDDKHKQIMVVYMVCHQIFMLLYHNLVAQTVDQRLVIYPIHVKLFTKCEPCLD